MKDLEESNRDTFRVQTTERLTRLEGTVSEIGKDIAKNTALTADVFILLGGIRVMAKLLIGIASVTAAVTVCWAAVVWLVKQAGQ